MALLGLGAAIEAMSGYGWMLRLPVLVGFIGMLGQVPRSWPFRIDRKGPAPRPGNRLSDGT